MKRLLSLCCMILLIGAAAVHGQPTAVSLVEAAKVYEAASPVALLDRQTFTTDAKLKSVLLAPNGLYIAYLSDEGHDTALHLYDLATGEKKRLFSSPTLATIHWTSDSRHLILNLGNAIGAVAMDQPDKPAYIATLDVSSGEQFLGSKQAVLDHIFIAGRYDDEYVLRQVSIDGESRELVRQDAMIVAALPGNDATVVMESATAQGSQFTLLDESGQRELFTCALLETCHLLAYDAAAKSLWLTANAGSNFIRLMEYSLAERELVVRHSHVGGVVDMAAAVLVQQQPVVVQYHDGLLQNYGLDEVTDMQLRAAQAQLPDSGITPQISNDRSRWLITESSSILQHPRYHLYDTGTGTLTEILREERASTDSIFPEALSQQIPVQYPAQDGSTLYGYVTLPKGVPLGAAPMITLVHGGPVGRIIASYSDFTQFLVNRGYIVFEPNFRASTGYGRNYVEQAAREFGDGLVQQDIIDGVYYLTGQGIGDPARLAIAGHSFGGSAVLAGLAFTPTLFKAGFASAPAADMVPVMRFQNSPEREANQDPTVAALFELLFGDVNDIAAMQAMSARSAQAKLSQIIAPLLLIAGGDDRQVPISHVKEYALELLNQQKTVSLFLDETEGHGIGQIAGRSKLAYFWMAEEFFATHLGGRKQPLDDQALAGYIQRKMLINNNPEFSVPVDD